jgi:hypothetical protein
MLAGETTSLNEKALGLHAGKALSGANHLTFLWGAP